MMVAVGTGHARTRHSDFVAVCIGAALPDRARKDSDAGTISVDGDDVQSI